MNLAMKKSVIASFLLLFFFSVQSQDHHDNPPSESPVIGRWDLTVDMGDKIVPSWLEVKLSGIKTLVGYYVAEGGSARPISVVNFKDGKFSFSIPPQWDNVDRNLVFEGAIQGDKISGSLVSSLGKTHTWTGVRAPSLARNIAPVWGEPIKLFNDKTLDGWHMSGKKNQWTVLKGVLTNPESGSNIISDRKFNDFKLHIEFRYPKGSNSGVYLRGRYELQVEDSKGKEASSIYFGGVYGFLAPSEMVAKEAGDWQTYDITLVGRMVTIVANGKKIISNQLIPGITGGALDSNEGEPGPIMLQGDHGSVEYRNIIVTPAK